MASTIRRRLVEKIHPILRAQSSLDVSRQEFLQRIAWCIRIPYPKKKEDPAPCVHIPYRFLQVAGIAPQVKLEPLQTWATSVVENICVGDVDLSTDENRFAVKLLQSDLIKTVLTDITKTRPLNTLCKDLSTLTFSRCKTALELDKHPQNVLVEYSSPNIAKPFHAGHLRSTVQGNVIANIYQYLGHNVTRINYLGDWGTQFGYIGVGLKKYPSLENQEDSTIDQYYKVYVQANQESEENPEIHEEAKQFFHRMEQGGESELSVWRDCKEASLQEYQTTYKRLGVQFDVYEGESMYKDQARSVVETLRQKGLVHTDADTGVTYLEVRSADQGEEVVRVKLLKSDGTTLYITRDIAAAIERYDKYQFDRLLYVVDEGQNKHFRDLLSCLQTQGHSWAKRPREDFHVGFGRVQGMSSRKGNVVFLKDILDEAKSEMINCMKGKQTTKVHKKEDLERVADHLAVSAIVVQDLKFPRMKPYTFQWDSMLRFTGRTGVFIQYTHARLCSLERTCRDNNIELDIDCDTGALTEPQALSLVLSLAGFDEAVYSAYLNLQPSKIVQYLLDVCHLTSTVLHSLNVLDQPKHVTQARLLMFHSARLIIAEGLEILSLIPLERM